MLYFDAKDNNDIEDFTIDFTNILASGETVSGAASTVVSGGVSVSSTTTSSPNVTVRITGGTAGSVAQVLVRAVMSSGRQIDETMNFDIVSN